MYSGFKLFPRLLRQEGSVPRVLVKRNVLGECDAYQQSQAQQLEN